MHIAHEKFASFLAVFLLITLCAAASESGDRDIPAEVAQLTDSLKNSSHRISVWRCWK